MLAKIMNHSFKNITRHLTGAKNIITCSFIIITLCFLNIILCSSHNSSALTYSSSVQTGFTFNPTISLTLSGDLVINNLTPGNTADSNTIDVTVATNNTTGYTLLATAGTSSTNTNLVNTANNSYNFTSIATSASLASLTTDNTWGFSYSSDSGTTWSNYSGLPLDNDDEGATGKQLAKTTSQSQNLPIQVKIGAKASQSQASGTYTNVINFYAVATPAARTYTINYLDPYNTASYMPDPEIGIIDGNYITIGDDEPVSSESDTFDGWCTTATDRHASCEGTSYQPGDSIYVGAGNSDFSINLYPLWQDSQLMPHYDINNNSSAEIDIDGIYTVAPLDHYSNVYSADVTMTINPPSECPTSWIWNASVYEFDFMSQTEVNHYDTGDNPTDISLTLPGYGNNYIVDFYGWCDD